MNTLIEKDYKCIMVTDCTAARNEKIQKKAEKDFEVIFSSELINTLNP